MRKERYWYFFVFSFTFLVILQAGCISVSSSPSPQLYMPHSMPKDQALQKFDFPQGVFIGVGPVRVPEYIDRPQMITRTKSGRLDIAQFDRWAEPIDSAMLRMLDENLVVMLSGVNTVKFPWSVNSPIRYQLGLDVIQMDSDLEKDLTLIVRWNIYDMVARQMVFSKRSQIVTPIIPHDYFGLSEALSAAVAKLSGEIAEQLSIAAKQPEKKN
jgi:uncharacterized lipoprotein YmbA